MSDSKNIKVCLTGARPIQINTATWPTIARAKDWDNQYEFQANRTWVMLVRQHADGRCLVYGWYDTAFQGEKNRTAGELVSSVDDAAAAAARVAESLGHESLAADLIDDLPASELA